jgi:hypothetical protein
MLDKNDLTLSAADSTRLLRKITPKLGFAYGLGAQGQRMVEYLTWLMALDAKPPKNQIN